MAIGTRKLHNILEIQYFTIILLAWREKYDQWPHNTYFTIVAQYSKNSLTA